MGTVMIVPTRKSDRKSENASAHDPSVTTVRRWYPEQRRKGDLGS
jgi:hypothetical protein